ncbi:hypothetical protein [Dongia sp. agr-C8]
MCWARRRRYALSLVCAGLLAGCAVDKKFEGITVSRNGEGTSPYLYNAMGSLEFSGQNPVVKATKVMNAACPQGQPRLLMADGPDFKIGNSTRSMLIAIFSCNQMIPGVE